MSIKQTKNAGGVYLNDKIKTINTQAHFYNKNTIAHYNIDNETPEIITENSP